MTQKEKGPYTVYKHKKPRSACISWYSDQVLCLFCSIVYEEYVSTHFTLKKKVREKSRECHNHKLQPFPDTRRKRKPTNPNKHKSNKHTKSTKISSLFIQTLSKNQHFTDLCAVNKRLTRIISNGSLIINPFV